MIFYAINALDYEEKAKCRLKQCNLRETSKKLASKVKWIPQSELCRAIAQYSMSDLYGTLWHLMSLYGPLWTYMVPCGPSIAHLFASNDHPKATQWAPKSPLAHIFSYWLLMAPWQGLWPSYSFHKSLLPTVPICLPLGPIATWTSLMGPMLHLLGIMGPPVIYNMNLFNLHG